MTAVGAVERAKAEAVKRRYSAYGTDGPAFVDGYLAAFQSIDVEDLARELARHYPWDSVELPSGERIARCTACGWIINVPLVETGDELRRHDASVVRAHLLGDQP